MLRVLITTFPLKSRLSLVVLALGAVLFSACASHPAGFTQAQWDSLTPRERADYRTQDAIQTRKDFKPMSQLVGNAIERVEKLSSSKPERDRSARNGW